MSDHLPNVYHNGAPIADTRELGKTIKGLLSASMPSGSSSNTTVINEESIIRGFIIRVIGPASGDHITIEHLDSSDTVLFKFLDQVFMTDSFMPVKLLGRLVAAGEKIKVTYMHNGVGTTRSVINMVKD